MHLVRLNSGKARSMEFSKDLQASTPAIQLIQFPEIINWFQSKSKLPQPLQPIHYHQVRCKNFRQCIAESVWCVRQRNWSPCKWVSEVRKLFRAVQWWQFAKRGVLLWTQGGKFFGDEEDDAGKVMMSIAKAHHVNYVSKKYSAALPPAFSRTSRGGRQHGEKHLS